MLEDDNSLDGVNTSVHEWLTHPERLNHGRASLCEDVVKLVARYESEFGATTPPRLCVSMCGSPKMAHNAASQLQHAKRLLKSGVGRSVDITCELMADSH